MEHGPAANGRGGRGLMWRGACSLLLLLVGCGPQAPPSGKGPTAAQGPGVQAPLAGQGTSAAQGTSTQPATTVSLEIDFGDARKKQYPALPWRDSMTALDALVAARDGAGGPPIQQRGFGETAFVEAIDGVANAGPRKEDRNWVYRINGRKGTKGAGVGTIQAGDHVLWEYALPD